MSFTTRGHILLDNYLNSEKAAKLAEEAGLDYMQIQHLTHRRRRASLDVAFALEDASGGFIEARAWTERVKAKNPGPIGQRDTPKP